MIDLKSLIKQAAAEKLLASSAERRYKALRTQIQDLMRKSGTSVARFDDGLLAQLVERSRTSLDREALEAVMGDRIKSFERRTPYMELVISGLEDT